MPVSVAWLGPNPTSDLVRLRFTLAKAGPVTIDLFDPSGRRVASAYRDELMTAGTHTVQISTARLHAGMYVCRVIQADFSVARKFAIVR